MKFFISILISFVFSITLSAQNVMTPDLLWKLGRVSAIGITKDGKSVIYNVTTPSLEENKSYTKTYSIPVTGGQATMIEKYQDLVTDKNMSPDGLYKLYHKEVQLKNIQGKHIHKDMPESNVYIYETLDYRHWDAWNTGLFNHVFYKKSDDTTETDIMMNQAFHSPQKPFGGDEDYIWSPDSKNILYVSKKKYGTDAALSTNTDLYLFNLETGETSNLTKNNPGYDTHPLYSKDGALAWLQMKRDGYEADKNDIIVLKNDVEINLTKDWDGTVNNFLWSADGKKIYFTAPVDGTIQLFEVDYPGMTKKLPVVSQITKGDFDISGLVALNGDLVIVTRTAFNHAAEIFSYNIKTKTWNQITKVNDDIYKTVKLSKVEKRYINATDGKKILTYLIFPPDFDPAKKYPTILYCQGGPQSALTQFYSFRWNLQLMAAQGYIIVAPNRRGMPGHGVEWNEQISKDWGGQSHRDLLSAIDVVSREPFVNRNLLGAVGASYGGYSVYYLAGTHEGRFKTFIAHNGVFNTQSMYGNTEEMFFVNWDMGGAYWEKNNEAAQKAFTDFNPINHVQKWETPILIIQGGKDYRVPIGQGQEAFQAAQLLKIKSKMLYFPEENHFILKPQNAIIWQRSFFDWLKETLI
ncbi:MAG: S9 family peptidase [Saprospiraceae bacterium]|nr:S9 family peptidase [Saprospiraceae bacterium]